MKGKKVKIKHTSMNIPSAEKIMLSHSIQLAATMQTISKLKGTRDHLPYCRLLLLRSSISDSVSLNIGDEPASDLKI